MSAKPLTKKEWQASVAEMWESAIESTYKDMIEKAVLAEREACAISCENLDFEPDGEGWTDGVEMCIRAIRARGQA